MLGEALKFLAGMVGIVALSVLVGSWVGCWVAVRRVTRHGIELNPGSLREKYFQILRLVAERRKG